VAAQPFAGECCVGGHLAQAGTTAAPCREAAATTAAEIAAPSENRPDLFPAEGDAIADRPPGGIIGFAFERARGSVVDRVVARRPDHGFSSRAPPVPS